VNSIQATRPEWFPQNKVNVPIQLSLKRSSRFPDVPSVIEFAKDEKTKQALKLIFSPQGMDRPVLAPPGTPPDKVAALRKAFMAAATDPRFVAEAKKQGLEVDPVPGEEVAEIIDDAYKSTPEIVKLAGDAMDSSSPGR
jgi:tripartite-type tricarboxylate transporter receptor subunit TctC